MNTNERISCLICLDQNRLQNSNSCSSIKNSVVKPLTEHSSRTADVGYKTGSKGKLKQSAVTQVNPLLGRLKRTTNGMEAFIVLFQRLTADVSIMLDFFGRDRKNFGKKWGKWKRRLYCCRMWFVSWGSLARCCSRTFLRYICLKSVLTDQDVIIEWTGLHECVAKKIVFSHRLSNNEISRKEWVINFAVMGSCRVSNVLMEESRPFFEEFGNNSRTDKRRVLIQFKMWLLGKRKFTARKNGRWIVIAEGPYNNPTSADFQDQFVRVRFPPLSSWFLLLLSHLPVSYTHLTLPTIYSV